MGFRLLGSLEVVGPDGPADFTAERQRIVLSVLLFEANRIVSTDRLVDAVWGASPPLTARAQIQICVSAIRARMAKAGLSDVVLTRTPGYVAEVDDADLDLRIFEQRAAAGRAAAEAGLFAEAALAFGDALALWHGQSHIGSGGTMLQDLAIRLNEQRLTVLEQWADAELALGLHQQLVEELIDQVRQNPLREHLRAQLMTALYRSGRQAEALEAYRRGRRELIEELGIEPGEELRRLEKLILSGESDYGPQDAAAGVARTPGAFAMTGPWAEAVPPEPPGSPRLLPGTIADFTGRDDLLPRLRAALEAGPEASPGLRIVSVTGQGGVGKTTLAVHLGHALAERFPDGQLFAKLRGLSGQPVAPAQILERFLQSLGVSRAAVPGLEERAELFRHHLADRRVLILLDDAVDEEQVRWLLPGSSNCPVLITSQSRLAGLEGARSIRVEAFSTEQSLQMLGRILGAERVHAELSSALELVQLCGHLPLALRITAARLAARPHWTLGQMAARLRDECQRLDELTYGRVAVRAGLASTCACLPPDASQLFQRLSLLEAADFPAWVAAPLLDRGAVQAEDALEALVDSQLVEVERVRGRRTRYHLHDLVRLYARERLIERESAAERSVVLGRLLSTWLFLVEEAHQRMYGADHTLLHGSAPRRALDPAVVECELADPSAWHEAEHSSLTAAVRQAADAGMDELCWDLAMTAVAMFDTRGHADAWRTAQEIALAVNRCNHNRRGQAAMLYSLGTLHMAEYRLDEARSRLESARELFRGLDEVHGEAQCEVALEFLDGVQGRFDEAAAGHARTQALLSRVDDPVARTRIHSDMLRLQLELGLAAEAGPVLAADLATAEGSGSRSLRARVLCLLGEARLESGDDAEAESLFTQTREALHGVGDPISEAYALRGIAIARLHRQRHGEAYTLLEQALSIAAQTNECLAVGRIQLSLGEAAAGQRLYERAKDHVSAALEIFGELGATRWQSRALRAMGDIWAAGDASVVAAVDLSRSQAANGRRPDRPESASLDYDAA